MNKIIEIKDLNIETRKINIIKDYSFSLDQGEFIGIQGPSGSGKSTILKYLAQLLDPDLKVSGVYKYMGKDILEYKPTDIRKQITYCFQNPSLFGKTVKDNLKFPYEIRDKSFERELAEEYLQKVDLSNNYLEKDIDTLSGGEKQRVALIRNLMIEPKVVLLDEISSALDKDTRKIVWNWLKDYREKTGVSMVMVTHLDDEYEMTDRIIEVESIQNKNKKDNIESEED